MNSHGLLACCALALLASACVVDDSGPDVIVVGDGLVTVDFTIDGATDARDCALSGADSIDVVITTSDGLVAGESRDACGAFTTSVDVAPGSYYGDATLLDRSGRAVTTTVDLGHFFVHRDTEVIVDADFPADSFY
jgi:hypothetical protein